MDTSEALDLSKENIQPLLHGRKTDKLSIALQVNSNFQLQQELKRHREEFELKIRLYNGEDPLQIRFEYIQWLEQSYPNLGSDTNFIPFLEETLSLFKNLEKYKQDPRYVSLVIKYIETQPNPLEIFNMVYNENIGTKLAVFYKAWANKLDSHGDVKQANHVFQLGVNANAEPLEELSAAQMNFQLSVGRRLLMGVSADEQPEEATPQRQVLGKLKKVAPGMTRLKMGDAGRLGQHGESKKPLQNVPSGLNVYMDPREDENFYSKEPSLQNPHFTMKATIMHKENKEVPGVWTKKSTKKFATPIPTHPSTPRFPIHMDEGYEETNCSSSVQMGSVLKVKKHVAEGAQQGGLFESAAAGKDGIRYMFSEKNILLGKSDLQFEEFRGAKYRMEKYGTCLAPVSQKLQSSKKAPKEDDIPVCIPEPDDETKLPMYRKKEVYVGGNKELQLEELRAAQYRRRSNIPEAKVECAVWAEEIPVCVPCFTENSVSMYPKSQIYIGNNKELQLEEVRAAQYKARKLAARKSQAIPAHKTQDLVPSQATPARKTQDLVPPQAILTHKSQDMLPSQTTPTHKTQDLLPAQSNSKAPSFTCYSDRMDQDGEKKLGLFDSPEKAIPYNMDLPKEFMDESQKDVYNLFDDMWKSPAANRTKPAPATREAKPLAQEPRLDVSDFTVNLVQDWWSSPSAKKAAACTQKVTSDGQFKMPVSVKKPVPTTTPFKLFSENANNAPVPPKTPSFPIFSDESERALSPPKLRSTPAREIFHDEPETARSSKPPGTPAFEIFSDEPEVAPSPPKPLRTPTFKIFSDEPEVAPSPPKPLRTPTFKIYSEEPEVAPSPPKPPRTPGFEIFSDEPDFATSPKPRTPAFKIYSEEESAGSEGEEDVREPPKLVLPYVAAAIDLDRQPLGLETKENCPPGDRAKEKRSLENQRVLNGYLVPSSVPIQVPEEDEDDEITDMTCNTRAFNFALPSSTSTPFVARRGTGNSAADSCEVNGSFLQDPVPSNLTGKTQCDTLSVILEASKEKSSSSSGTSSSAYSAFSGGPGSYFNSCEKKTPRPVPIYEDDTSDLEDSIASLHVNKIDPFDEKMIDYLLSHKVQFPLARHRVGYACFFSELHTLKVNSHASLGNTEYTTLKELGKGAYARVLMGRTASDQKVALKQQKPSCVWEWYISKEIEYRLKPSSPLLAYFVLPHHIYVFKNSSVLVAPWAKFGNLLDLVNAHKARKGKSLSIHVCLKLSLEMVQAVHTLHKINIIHGDVKPDNFVISNLMRSGLPSLQLIDFGRSIDMTLFPPGTTFNTVVTTDGFQCTEMKEKREWSYHTDVYGLAGSMCCVLLGKYMSTVKKGNRWCLADTIPRYLCREVMEPIFDSLLNVPLDYKLATLEDIMVQLQRAMTGQSDEGLQAVDEVLMQLKH